MAKLHVCTKEINNNNNTKRQTEIFFRLRIVQSSTHTDQGSLTTQLSVPATSGKKSYFP